MPLNSQLYSDHIVIVKYPRRVAGRPKPYLLCPAWRVGLAEELTNTVSMAIHILKPGLQPNAPIHPKPWLNLHSTRLKQDVKVLQRSVGNAGRSPRAVGCPVQPKKAKRHANAAGE